MTARDPRRWPRRRCARSSRCTAATTPPGTTRSAGSSPTPSSSRPTPHPRACAAAVKEAVRLGLVAARATSSRRGAGCPRRPGMFAISWLDLRRLPVRDRRRRPRGAVRRRGDPHRRRDALVRPRRARPAPALPLPRHRRGPPARRRLARRPGRPAARRRPRLGRRHGWSLGDRASTACSAPPARTSPALVALLADDEIGRTREGADLARYEAAYDAVARDPAQYLAAVRDEADRVVGTMQLTIIPGPVARRYDAAAGRGRAGGRRRARHRPGHRDARVGPRPRPRPRRHPRAAQHRRRPRAGARLLRPAGLREHATSGSSARSEVSR